MPTVFDKLDQRRATVNQNWLFRHILYPIFLVFFAHPCLNIGHIRIGENNLTGV